MKKKFSTSWLSSKQPRKQRKYRYNAPLHLRHKFLNAHLSKSIREKYGKRSVPLRKGDEVLIMRGSFKGKKGKILETNLKRSKVTVEGINRKKADGTKVNVYFNPSNLQIEGLNLDDRKRLKLARKADIKKEVKEKSKEENASNKNTSN